ncbi:hypothetical protein GCK72_007402 [Caenorhabditis remanei]|uniref:F-box domain-containing protein n=1 Tax=Caenorhabditis remanei TaxID=31234 RepID=A0A6A5HM47_CAERE|nr:hypothetical protein GCK72_007402 [Caenorhabditis remanei]KAF1767443.1 hypothetical protein GCK72_007402 [Caenorhabditis remanei]
MNSIPLQYESLKAVLLYMDPNVRFIIAHRAPTIRSTERTVPLRVRYLELDEYSTAVNNTLGVYRDYDADEKIPSEVEMYNKYGVQYDFDRHGFPVALGFSVLKPGDILIGNLDGHDFEYDTVHVERAFRRALKRYEKSLYLLSNPSASEASDDEEEEEEEEYNDSTDMSKEELEDLIDSTRDALLPFECRRFNLKPPYTCYIQLTIESGEKRQIQRFPYKMKVYEAMKRLNNFLFGGRRSAIQVGELYIHDRSFILRLPIGFQVRTKELRYLSNLDNRNDSIVSMLDSSYFPLDVVSIYVNHQNNFQIPIVTSAKKLIIHNLGIVYDVSLSPLIRKCSNPHVVLADTFAFITAEGLFEAVQLWIEGIQSIETSVSLGIEKEETVKELFKLIIARVENTKRTKRCVSMRTPDNSRLEVFYVPNKSSKDQIMYGYDSKWILKIRAVQF